MFNTLPSGNPTQVSGASRPITALGGINDTTARRSNLKAFFSNTAANILRLGNRFAWAANLTHNTPWVPIFSLDGSGVVNFLALWRDGTASSAVPISFRVVVDGTVVLEITSAWTSAGDGTDGYVLVGDLLWDEAAADPEYGGLNLESIPFSSRFSVETSATSLSNDDIEAVYRYYMT